MAGAHAGAATRSNGTFPLLLGLLLAFAGTLPLLLYGPSCGHDFDFHLQSWLAVKAAWHAHLVAPSWVEAANYGAGEPRFLFYPPLSWVLGGLLGTVLCLILPGVQAWSLAPLAFTFIAFAGAAASMYSLARRYTPLAPAALAAALYGLSPYLLFNAYERTAYGELLAAVWFPLLLGVLLPVVADPYLQPEPMRIERIAILLAALWYTNAPSGVMGCYLVLFAMVVIVLLWTGAVLRRQPQVSSWSVSMASIASLAGALVLGCTLSADYLFPAWYEQRSVAIARAIGPGMQVQDSFLFGRTGEPFHDQVLRTASWITVATLSVALVSGLAIWLRRQRGGPDGSGRGDLRIAVFLCVGVLVCALLQLPWSLPVWHLLPQMAFLQFPWRLLLPVTAVTSLLAGMALKGAQRYPTDNSEERHLSGRKTDIAVVALILCVVYGIGVVGWAAHTRYQPCDDEDRVAAQLALLGSGLGFEGSDEYAPKDTDNGEIQQGLPFVRLAASPDADEGDDSLAANPRWQPSVALLAGSVQIVRGTPEAFTVRVQPVSQAPNTQSVFALLRLERSPDWQIELNGQPCAAACGAQGAQRADGLLTVRLPVTAGAATAVVITGHYRSGLQARWDVWLGRSLTLSTLLLLVLMRRRGLKQARRQPAGEQMRRASYDRMQ